MKNIINFFFIPISLLLIVFLAFTFDSPNSPNRLTFGLIVIIPIILFIVMPLKLQPYGQNKIAFRRFFRIFLFVSFFLYLLCLIYLLFFGYGRNQVMNVYTIENYKQFYQTSTNFIPFETILLYANDHGKYLNPGIAFVNIGGNILAFAPFGFFMPLLFKRFKSWLSFLLLAIGLPILVELLQFFTLRGSTDIDDVILNTSGAVIIFTLMKIPYLSKQLAYLSD